MASTAPPRLYFAYGSNLSPTQMSLRCPCLHALGLAHLPDHTFIINTRRYANVVPNGPVNPADPAAAATTTNPASTASPTPSHPQDEATLDRCEGVPHAYQKQHLTVSIVNLTSDGTAINLIAGSNVPALVYVDTARTEPSTTPWAEYIDRMNRGVDEATERFRLPRDEAGVREGKKTIKDPVS
ncbi:uncharacterized protein N0V96_008399 [Colletotrichum fioriniae]|uniref:uncharacterized protein n=1 Tax=Colletotrichum fioriniae TaxID=710243 RepID=UPI0032DA909E|nr:hypothetical protein N0V96_008399 [Colletotrichum fioriniae]